MEYKICYQCKKRKPITEFTRDKGRASGYGGRCKDCTNEYSRRWKRENPERRYATQQRYYYTAQGFYTKLKFAAKRRGNEFYLGADEFIEWFNSQELQCHYCKRQLTRGWGYRVDNITVDRRENDKGYFLDNMFLSCRRCNTIKGNTFTEQEMLEIADKYIKPKLKRGEL